MAVDTAAAAFTAQEWRYESSSDAAIQTRHPLARDIVIESLIQNTANAAALAAAMQAFSGAEVDRMTCRLHAAEVSPGQTITMPNGRLAFVETVSPYAGDVAEYQTVQLLVKRN